MGKGMLKYFYGLLSSTSGANVLNKERKNKKKIKVRQFNHVETPKPTMTKYNQIITFI